MTRLLSVTALIALMVWVSFVPSTSAQVSGVVNGVVRGPAGPIAGVTVNALNTAGMVVGSAVTTSSGAYSIGNLAIGFYTIQVVSNTGAVLVTGAGTVAATAIAATVNLTLTAGQLAAAGIAAGAAVGAAGTAAGLSAATALSAAAAAGAGVATTTIRGDSSPTQ